VNYISINETES